MEKNKFVRIGLLEDNAVISDMLTIAFENAGWECSRFETVAAMSQAIDSMRFDVLVLDWLLPDGKAETIIRQIRNRHRSDLPILIESLIDDESLVVHALKLGADDYVVKPLRLSEVMARIEALLRRYSAVEDKRLRCGNFQVDTERGILLNGEEQVELTKIEYKLICYLFQHRSELLTRNRLLREVWGVEHEPDTRTVDAHIGRLRNKLSLGSERGLEIVTVHGLGYRLEENST